MPAFIYTHTHTRLTALSAFQHSGFLGKQLEDISKHMFLVLLPAYVNGPFSGTTQVSRYQKGKTNLDFIKASEWQWHQLGHMQVCTSLQTDNHARNPPLSFLQAGCPSCHPINSVKALKEPFIYLNPENKCITIFLPLNAGLLPSVLSRCWLGGRKGIRPVKN